MPVEDVSGFVPGVYDDSHCSDGASGFEAATQCVHEQGFDGSSALQALADDPAAEPRCWQLRVTQQLFRQAVRQLSGVHERSGQDVIAIRPAAADPAGAVQQNESDVKTIRICSDFSDNGDLR